LEGEEKKVLRGLLQKDKNKLQKSSSDWLSVNLTRARALKLLEGLGE